MKKSIKITIIVFIGMILFVYNALFGNPICNFFAKCNIDRYLSQNYSQKDYQLEQVYYNLKTNGYEGEILSPSAIDEHFHVSTNRWGIISSDDYDNVLSGWNTWNRLCEDYRLLTEPVLFNLPYESDIAYGKVALYEKSENEFSDPFGLVKEELVINGNYDMTQVGKEAGYLVYYVQSDEISMNKAAEILLTLRETFDDAGIRFYSIDFTLQNADEEIHILNFLYENITSNGLSEKIEKRHQEVTAWYECLDDEKRGIKNE